MKVKCPKCGELMLIDGLGRRAFNIPVTEVCDALSGAKKVSVAAELLKCSRAYIYKILKANGLTAKDLIR
jgi:hypothetical protein